MLSTLSPTALPTLHPQPIKFDYNNNKWYYFKQNKNQKHPINPAMTSVLFQAHSYIGKYSYYLATGTTNPRLPMAAVNADNDISSPAQKVL